MNESIFYFFYSFAHKWAYVDWVIIFFAQTFPYVVVMLAGLFLLFHHEVFRAENIFQTFMQKKKEILLVFFAGGAGWLVTKILKIIIHADRPFVSLSNLSSLFPETGYTFPSQHTVFFSAIAFMIFFTHKKAGYAFMLFALIIGMARIAAGVHYPADIVGGFLLGGGVAYLVAYLVKKL